jgi:hypothetical protein
MDETYPQDLIRNVAASTGLPEATASRVVADVVAYFSETVEAFVTRRHAELQGKSKRNDAIWPQLAAELKVRRFRAAELTERQLRRIIYGDGKPRIAPRGPGRLRPARLTPARLTPADSGQR